MAEKYVKTFQEVAVATEGVAGISFPGVLTSQRKKLTDIDIHINVFYGVSIPEVAWNVQENIKKAALEIPGLDIGKINIHVDNISFKNREYF